MNKKFKQLDAINQVAEFHRMFNHPIVEDEAKIPGVSRVRLRIELLEEELKEFKDACAENDIVEVADALCDLQYVLIGAVHEFGLGKYFPALMDEVQRSNMSKVCKDEIEANDTIAYYRKQNVVAYKELVENGEYLIKRKSDDKVLKSVAYSPAKIYNTIIDVDNKELRNPYAPHQQRVVDEKAELHTRLNALNLFIDENPIFNKLDEQEQLDLKQQAKHMAEYNYILERRISNFNK